MSFKASTPPKVNDSGAAAQPTDTTSTDTTSGGSTWGNIANSLWDSLKTDITNKLGTGSSDNTGGGAGSGTPTEGSLTKPPETGSVGGIKHGDGVPPGKGDRDDRGFRPVGDKTDRGGDGGKTPPDDSLDFEPVGGKTLKGEAGEKTPREDGGDLEHVGGKTVEEGENDCVPRERDGDGRLQKVGNGKLADSGTSPKPDVEDSDPRAEKAPPPGRPTDQLPKPTLPPVIPTEKTGADRYKGQVTDQIKKIPQSSPGPSGQVRTSKYGPYPEGINAEVPSAADQEEAIGALGEVASEMGVEAMAEDAAEDIINGKFEKLQATLKKLETKEGGALELEEMAKQLGNLLGTEVLPDTSGQFGLNIMTQYSDSRGDLPTGTSITRLNIPSTGGDITSSGERFWNPDYKRSFTTDVATESRRLRALATRSISGWGEGEDE